MERRTRLVLAAAIALGCSREERAALPAPPPAAPAPPASLEDARAGIEAAARDLASHAVDATATQAPSAGEEARTRAALEAVAQEVRRQLDEKAAANGNPPAKD